MSTQNTTILIGLGVYALLMVVIGLWGARKETAEGFVIGSRDVGYIPTMSSLATGFRDGSGLVFWVGAGATFIFGGLLSLLGGVLLGLLFFSFVGPRVRRMAKERGYITIGQIIRDELGGRTEKVSSFIVAAFSIILISVQLFVSGNLISTISPLSSELSITLVGLIVALYMFFGGYGNVIKTDVVQFFLVVSLIFLPFFINIDLSVFLEPSNYKGYGTSMDIAFFLMGMFYIVVSSDAWQRLFSARNKKVVRYGFPSAVIPLVIMTMSLFFLGVAARELLPADTEWSNAFFQLYEFSALPPFILAYVAVVCVAITMSTMDTLCYLSASTFLKNILPESYTEKRGGYVKLTRIAIILVLALSAFMATTIGDVIKYIFDAVSLLFVLAPLYVLAGMGYLRKSARLDSMIAISLIVSTSIYIYMFTHNHFQELIMIYVPTVICTVLTVGAVISDRTSRKART